MSESGSPLVSVVLVAYDRAAMLDACLESLDSQSEARHEVVVVLNEATAETARVAARHHERNPRVRPLPCSRRSASEARNFGVSHARAPIVYFVDDDVVVPDHCVARVVELFTKRPELSILGGPNLTPPNDPDFGQLCGAILASRLGTGVTRSRYVRGTEHPATERDLILCNMAARRDLFDQGIRFPTVFGGEENVLLGHAQHRGHSLWYQPDLWVYHHRRSTLTGHVQQMFRYGWGRAWALRLAPKTFHPAYFLPVGLLAYLIASPFLLALTPWAAVPLVVYAVVVSVASAAVALHARRLVWFAWALLLFPLTHLAYAAGLLTMLPRRRHRDSVPGELDRSATRSS